MPLANPEISLGHMLNQHYLEPIFPLAEAQNQATKEENGIGRESGATVDHHTEHDVGDNVVETFLDRIVTPDEKLAKRRDVNILHEMGIVRRESGLEFGSGQVLKDTPGLADGKDASDGESLTFVRTPSNRIVAEEARGKTVRDLSRLWKYLGGKSPMDHDYGEDGYDDDCRF